VYTKTGKYRLAEYHFRKAAEINPSNAMLICCVGTVCFLSPQSPPLHFLVLFADARVSTIRFWRNSENGGKRSKCTIVPVYSPRTLPPSVSSASVSSLPSNSIRSVSLPTVTDLPPEWATLKRFLFFPPRRHCVIYSNSRTKRRTSSTSTFCSGAFMDDWATSRP
jgi:hypothetical protein